MARRRHRSTCACRTTSTAARSAPTGATGGRPLRESTASVLPRLFLARHGDTAWTDTGQPTGRTDMPLNERGEEHARDIGKRLREFTFASVFTSPLQRAAKTCELAG